MADYFVYTEAVDTPMKKPSELERALNALVQSGITFHHVSARCGYCRKQWGGFIREYNGRFGSGYIIITHRTERTVNAAYYIQGENIYRSEPELRRMRWAYLIAAAHEAHEVEPLFKTYLQEMEFRKYDEDAELF